MFDIHDCMAFVVNESSKIFADALDKRLQPFGLSKTKWLAIYYINDYEEITQAQLAILLRMTAPTIVKIIQGLEREGYVEKRWSREDRRQKYVSLTVRGKSVLIKSTSIVMGFKRDIISGISDADLETTKEVIAKMTGNARILLKTYEEEEYLG